MAGGVSAQSSSGAATPALLIADRSKLRISPRSKRRIDYTAVDVGLVAWLFLAVLVQGVGPALGLPHRVTVLADVAAAALVVWLAIMVLRSGAPILIPYLVIAFAALLVIGALRSDDALRLFVAARNFLLLPALALALAALGPSERRNRALTLAVLGLAVVEFFVTVDQALTLPSVDSVVGTFGDNASPQMAFAILAGTCLALGIYAAGVGRTWWLALAVALPLFSIWGAVRAVLVVAPVAALTVAVATWWVSAASTDRSERRRRPLTVAIAAVLCGAAVFGGYAIFRSSELGVFTNASERSLYLRNGDIYAQPNVAQLHAHGWSGVDSQVYAYASGRKAGGGEMVSVHPSPGALYAGAVNGNAKPLKQGQTYSFLTAVRTSVAGQYHLFAGPYSGATSNGVVNVSRLGANEWSWLRAQRLTVKTPGAPFFALQSDSGNFAGKGSISLSCMTVVKGPSIPEPPAPSGKSADCSTVREQSQPGAATGPPAGTKQPTRSSHEGRNPRTVPGRLTQYRTAARLISGSPLSFLFGNGLGATTYAVNLGVRAPPRDERVAGYSDFGTLVVELGWLGVVLAAACVLALGLGSIAAARRAPLGTWTRALLLAYPGVLVAMIAGAFLSTPFRNVGSASIFWILTGLVLASILGHRPPGGVALGRG